MDDSEPRLSYKFQRLRERLREAIVSGELQGKLPGERTLAKRFGANAKTLGKALTDLAADGLLERTIGRGTFVRASPADAAEIGSDPARGAPAGRERWLCLHRADDPVPCASALCELHPSLKIVSDLTLLRPSFLAHFTAVIDMHGRLPESIVRDLLVRGLRVIRYDSAPQLYATDTVMLDRAFSATLQARDLIRTGHRAIYAVDDASGELLESARAAVRRLEVDATVAPLAAAAIGRAPSGIHPPSAVGGRAAYLCGSMELAGRVRDALEAAGVRIPGDASVAGVGLDDDDRVGRACSGYAVTPMQVAATIVDLIGQSASRRPAPIWLVGAFIDRGTTTVAAPAAD